MPTVSGTASRPKKVILALAIAITIVFEVVWDGSCWDKHQAHQTAVETRSERR